MFKIGEETQNFGHKYDLRFVGLSTLLMSAVQRERHHVCVDPDLDCAVRLTTPRALVRGGEGATLQKKTRPQVSAKLDRVGEDESAQEQQGGMGIFAKGISKHYKLGKIIGE